MRQHAEDKIYSALGRLRALKERRPETIIGVLGCMAQKDQDRSSAAPPHVDLVVGPGQLPPAGAAGGGGRAIGRPRLEVSLDRIGRQPARWSRQSFARFDPPRDRPSCAAVAVPGDGADHVRLRQVLHLLRRAAASAGRSRAARPRRSWTRSAAWPTTAAWK